MSNTLRNRNIFRSSYSSYTCSSTRTAWILNGGSLSFTFSAGHLNCHRSLSVINCSFSSTGCTSGRSSSWLTFASTTSDTNSFFFILNSFASSFYRVHETNINCNMNVSSFSSSCSLSSHVKERFKISKHIFVAGLAPESSKSSKRTSSSKRILSISKSCLLLFISSQSHLVINISF